MVGIERFSKGRPSAKQSSATTTVDNDSSSSTGGSSNNNDDDSVSKAAENNPFASSGPLAHLSRAQGSFESSFEYGGGGFESGDAFGNGFGGGFGFEVSASSSRDEDSVLMPPPAGIGGGTAGIGIFQNRPKAPPPIVNKTPTGRKVTFHDSVATPGAPTEDCHHGTPPFTSGGVRPSSTEGTTMTPKTPAASARPSMQGNYITPQNSTKQNESMGESSGMPGFKGNIRERAQVMTAERDNNLVSPPINFDQTTGSYGHSTVSKSSGFSTTLQQEGGGSNQGISSFRGRKFAPSVSNGTTKEFTTMPPPRGGDFFMSDASRPAKNANPFSSAPRNAGGGAEGGNSGPDNLQAQEAGPAIRGGHEGRSSDENSGAFSNPSENDFQYQTPGATYERQGEHHYQTPNATTATFGQRTEVSPFEGIDMGGLHSDFETPHAKPPKATQDFFTPFNQGRGEYTHTEGGQKEGHGFTGENVPRVEHGPNGMMAQTNVATPPAQEEQVSPGTLQECGELSDNMGHEEASYDKNDIDWEAVHEEISQTTQDCRDILKLFDGDLLEANMVLEMANSDVLRMQASTIDQIAELQALEAALDDMIDGYTK